MMNEVREMIKDFLKGTSLWPSGNEDWIIDYVKIHYMPTWNEILKASDERLSEILSDVGLKPRLEQFKRYEHAERWIRAKTRGLETSEVIQYVALCWANYPKAIIQGEE